MTEKQYWPWVYELPVDRSIILDESDIGQIDPKEKDDQDLDRPSWWKVTCGQYGVVLSILREERNYPPGAWTIKPGVFVYKAVGLKQVFHLHEINMVRLFPKSPVDIYGKPWYPPGWDKKIK